MNKPILLRIADAIKASLDLGFSFDAVEIDTLAPLAEFASDYATATLRHAFDYKINNWDRVNSIEYANE